MPRLPKTATSMEDGEPSLGRFVVDANAGGEGMVVEVKVGGWRVLLSADGSRSSKRSAALEYVADREPPEELVGRCAALGVAFSPYVGERRVVARTRRSEDGDTAAPRPAGREHRGRSSAGGARRRRRPSARSALRRRRVAPRRRVPRALAKPPKALVGFGYRAADGALAHVVGFRLHDGDALLVELRGAARLVPLADVRAAMIADEESVFGRVAKAQRRAAAPNKLPARKSDSPTPKRKRGAEPDDDSDADGSDDAADDAAPAAAPGLPMHALLFSPVQS
ncbi:hypothetical protein JL721_3927 [Aureococcus anophagefferens]|nr:hypothetical protein JL721_3927 [Aureococcus anophagefferens]